MLSEKLDFFNPFHPVAMLDDSFNYQDILKGRIALKM